MSSFDTSPRVAARACNPSSGTGSRPIRASLISSTPTATRSVNALVIVTNALEAELSDALRLLKYKTDAKDDRFFATRGLKDAREFYAHYLRLGGVLVIDEASVPPRIAHVRNREARRPLPEEAIGRLSAANAGSTMHSLQ
jgi:hypothetical protein